MHRQLVKSQTDEEQTVFELFDPQDAHEEMFQVWMSTQAWESQDSPEELFITLTAVKD